LPDTKQPTQLPRLAGVGICLAEPPSASRGNFGPSILVPAQAEFDVEVSVVVPILAVQETSRPNPATVPVQPFYPLEPVAAREAVLEPSREPARIESLRLPVALPALSERLRAQDWPHQIGQAGFCPVPPPDVQQIEIIPLPGAEFVSLEPELVFPAPAAPEKARAALPTSGKAKEWIRAIDDDPWPMAGATWFEQRVRIAMPLLTIAASGRMKQPQRLWPIRPACYLPGARACAAVGAFDVEWPARKAILPYGESLPIATPIRSDMYAPLAAPPPKREVAPVEALPGFFATLPGRVKRLSVGIPLMMMFLFALWSSDSTGKGGPWARLTTAIQHRAMAEYIEDFHKGTNAWRGDGNTGANWSYDPAGFIRPANLGLYQPSMAMTDYRMEFLGQIDQKSLGWVFRASNARNYYAMKLEIVKPGPLPEVAIVRYSVVDGHPGAAVRVPVRVNFHNSTPYRVRSEIAGKKFATYIEDELADIFTDDRFQKGGIGFFSEKDERASLYWVKVTDNDDFLGRVCSHLTSQKVQPSTALQSLILNRWIFDGGSPAPFLLNSQIR